MQGRRQLAIVCYANWLMTGKRLQGDSQAVLVNTRLPKGNWFWKNYFWKIFWKYRIHLWFNTNCTKGSIYLFIYKFLERSRKKRNLLCTKSITLAREGFRSSWAACKSINKIKSSLVSCCKESTNSVWSNWFYWRWTEEFI